MWRGLITMQMRRAPLNLSAGKEGSTAIPAVCFSHDIKMICETEAL